MSEIKFIQEFGDELERMIAGDNARQHPAVRSSVWTRLRGLIRGHKPLAIILVAVTVAGCATAIALTRKQAQTTVAYGITCVNSNSPAKDWTPVAVFGNAGYSGGLVFSGDPLTGCALTLGVSRSRLIACVQPNVGVRVYLKSDAPAQCADLHLQPFNAKYRQALAQMTRLNRALIRLDYRRTCWQPSALAKETNAILSEYQFTGWRAKVDPHQEMAFAGPCGSFPTAAQYANEAASTALLLLDPHSHTVPIYYGAPLPVLHAMVDLESRMQTDSMYEVLTLQRLRALVLKTFAQDAPHQSLRLVLQLTTDSWSDGHAFGNSEWRTYQRGGAILYHIMGGLPSGKRPVNGMYTLDDVGEFHRNVTVTYTRLGH